MKTTGNRVNRRFGKALLAFCMLMIMAVSLPLTSQAAVKAGTTKAKAAKVKVGTMNFYTKSKDEAFLKFTAPSAGTYKFTFSNLARYGYKSTSSKSGVLGSIMVRKYRKLSSGTTVYDYVKVSTQGGKTDNLSIESAYWYNLLHKGETGLNVYLKSRYGKVKLKKGETIYFRTYFCGDPVSFTLKTTKS